MLTMPKPQLYSQDDTVRSVEGLSLSRSFMGPKTHIQKRRANGPGHIVKVINASDYLVMHEGESVPAIYAEEELRHEHKAFWKVSYTEEHGIWYFKEFRTYHEVSDFLWHMNCKNTAEVTGPYFSDKEELEEGTLESVDLFSHLTTDDDEL